MLAFLDQLWIARLAILGGLRVTVEISLQAIVMGTVIGLFGGLILTYGAWPLRFVVRLYVDIMRGIPVLVLILATFYGVTLLKLQLTPYYAGVVALGAFAGAHIAELTRGAVGSIPLTQTEAAKAIGLGFWKRLWFVILPQAARRLLPPWVNTAVEIVKGSTLLLVIGIVELLLASQQVVARTQEVGFYILASFIFLIINFAISQAGALLERRFAYLQTGR